MCLRVLGSGCLIRALQDGKRFQRWEKTESKFLSGREPPVVAAGPVAQPRALLVVIPMEMAVGCRRLAKEAGSWGRRSWAHTPALPRRKLYVPLLIPTSLSLFPQI